MLYSDSSLSDIRNLASNFVCPSHIIFLPLTNAPVVTHSSIPLQSRIALKIQMMHTLSMIRAPNRFGQQARHIEDLELLEALFLRVGDGRAVGDDDLVDAFAGFEFFEAVVAEESWWVC
jgi:hypothetical protein